jgi:hypothetical protein
MEIVPLAAIAIGMSESMVAGARFVEPLIVELR